MMQPSSALVGHVALSHGSEHCAFKKLSRCAVPLQQPKSLSSGFQITCSLLCYAVPCTCVSAKFGELLDTCSITLPAVLLQHARSYNSILSLRFLVDLQGLNEEVQFLIAARGKPQQVAPGHEVCTQGDAADCVWLLHEGEKKKTALTPCLHSRS